jgi:phosphatidate phosphatase APP1
MTHKLPILLSFHALAGNDTTLISGQLTYTTLSDFSFRDYSRRKTLRTLVRLYRTKPYADQYIVLIFDKAEVRAKTDGYGSFYMATPVSLKHSVLQKVVLASGAEVKMVEDLYPLDVQEVVKDVIVVSDIDDTLMHSFIYRKIRKFRTLMFTAVEKRKAVLNMQEVLYGFTRSGAVSFYLSNSEQNLYPLIYRFLLYNNFPPGPLFLKKMRRLWDVLWNVKFPLRNIHKQQTLKDMLVLFPDKKFVLMGDNTQQDLIIYLEAAEQFPQNIRYIIIRKVIDKKEDDLLLKKYEDTLKANNIRLHYGEQFPYLSPEAIPPSA